MRLRIRGPRGASSAVSAGKLQGTPVLDAHRVVVANRWGVARGVWIVGRPAVAATAAVTLPKLPLPGLRGGKKISFGVDFGGHLFVLVVGEDTRTGAVIEAGPLDPSGRGALVPFDYPEAELEGMGELDFPPLRVVPPDGLDEAAFATMLLRAHDDYDGDQRYLVIEIPFLRVGRDSNSYAMGVLLASGIDRSAIPTLRNVGRTIELTGYPGAEDPVNRANFGVYFGPPTTLAPAVHTVATHGPDGQVRYVEIGGEPGTELTYPDGTTAKLPASGRLVLAADAAKARGLPARWSKPPSQIAGRRRFPSDPAPAGAWISLVVDGESVPLGPHANYRGSVAVRNDTLGIAILQPGEIVLPLGELGGVLRDPSRVDRLLRLGRDVTVGLHGDRRPRLVAHDTGAKIGDAFGRRVHLPQAIAWTAGSLAVLLGGGFTARALLARR